MNYCSNCGSNELNFVIPIGDHKERFVCANCTTIHYSNPNVIVGTLVVHNGGILLAKRAIEPRLGLWNLPAGFLENNELTPDGAKRETFEETLAKVEIKHLHCVYDLPKVNQVYLFYRAELLQDTIGVTPESSEVRFFKFNEIPWDELAFTSSAFAIKTYLENKESTQTHIGSYTF